MSVATERARIAAIAATIDGVVSTSAAVPKSLASVQVPAVIVMTGEATRRRDGGIMIIERVYTLALLVKAAVAGVELEAEQACEPFFPRFETAFGQRPGLQLADNTTPLDGVQHSELGNDSGVIGIELGGVAYLGVRFDLHVLSYRDIPRGL